MKTSTIHFSKSDGSAEKLVILQPSEGQIGFDRTDRTGLFWVHGGGYRTGFAGMPQFVGRPRACVNKYGTVVVSPAYTLSFEKPFPAAIQDCYEALVYFVRHASDFGVRDDQIFVGGESAGGGATAALCLLARDRGEVNIAFQLPLYPMLDDRDTESSKGYYGPGWNTIKNHDAWKLYLRDAYGTDNVSKYAAPARETDYRGLPPCYTFCSRNEPFYCETLAYVDNLRKAGIEAEVDVYDGPLIHAFDILQPTLRQSRCAARAFEEHYKAAVAKYFKAQTR